MTLLDLLHTVPYAGFVLSSRPSARPLVTRLVEQSLPGVLVAAISIYAASERQAVQLADLKAVVAEIRVELKQMRTDLYRPISGVRHAPE